MIKKILLGSIFLLPIIFSACKQRTEEAERSAYRTSGDTVYVDKASYLSEKIVVLTVEEELYTKEIITAGTVQAIPTQFAYIAPPFAGRVIKSYIKLGQRVNVNTPLFEISSADYTTVQKEFFQAQSERELARYDKQRKDDLIKNGVGSQRELEEADNTLRIAEKEYENAHAALRILQTKPETMTLGQPLIIRSPVAGNVIENNLITGQYINSESDHVAIVADLAKVWIVAQVKEKDIRFIHIDDRMDIHIAALPSEHIEGKIYYIDESIDEETRSIRVLSICDNKDDLLKLGMYTTVHFLDKPVDSVVIPEKSLLQGEKDSYVFVELDPNVFIRRPITVEVTKDGKAVIASGLTKGEKIIGEGGYYLK